MSADAKAVGIYGSRNSGKSTLARELAKPFACAVAIDPAGDWGASKGWTAVDTLPGVRAAMIRNFKKGFKLAFTPRNGAEGESLNQIAKWCLEFQAAYHARNSTRKLCLVCDEMAEAYSNADQQRKGFGDFRQTILQGRHYGIELIGISQRPQDVATRFRSNVAVTYAFRIGEPAARKPIAGMMEGDAGQLARLDQGEYLEIEAGRVKKGRTKRPAKR